jgi:nitrogen fixation NifU-like protein
VSDGDDRLQARVLEHARAPLFSEPLADATLSLSGGLNECSDHITVWLRADDRGCTVHAAVDGCSVSRGAASLLLAELQGRSLAQLAALDEQRLTELVGARIMLARPRCATLALLVVRTAARRCLEKRGIADDTPT